MYAFVGGIKPIVHLCYCKLSCPDAKCIAEKKCSCSYAQLRKFPIQIQLNIRLQPTRSAPSPTPCPFLQLHVCCCACLHLVHSVPAHQLLITSKLPRGAWGQCHNGILGCSFLLHHHCKHFLASKCMHSPSVCGLFQQVVLPMLGVPKQCP